MVQSDKTKKTTQTDLVFDSDIGLILTRKAGSIIGDDGMRDSRFTGGY